LTSPAAPVFVCSGNGGAWPGMAAALISAPAFAESLRASAAALAALGYPAPLLDVLGDARVEQVALGQPAHTAFQIALAELLAAMGVRPAAVIGHSLGEAAAACIAGILTREEALRIVVARSRLQEEVSGLGAMAVAAASADAVAPLLPAGVEIAGENGPVATVVSGAPGPVAAAIAALDASGIAAMPVRVPVAYHSAQMEPLVPRLVAALVGLAPRTGSVPFVSTVTGTALPGEALDAAYWGRNLRAPVRFRQGIAALAAAGHCAYLELAPHPLLGLSIRQVVPEALVASPFRRGEATDAALRAAVAGFGGVRRGVRPRHLLVLSARTATALAALAHRWAERIVATPDAFADLCHTALVGRERFAHRLALHAADAAEAVRRLRAGDWRGGIVGPGPAAAFDTCRAADEGWEAWLDRCAAAFVAGAEIDAEAFEAGEPWRVTDAPTYPFERERHWLAGASIGGVGSARRGDGRLSQAMA
jgi:polyketide synthase 12/myxalamid-type polyketide synthase MxaF